MWGIGKYMEELASRVKCGIAERQAIKEMARRWMEDESTTAESARDEIEVGIYHLDMRVMY